MITVVCWRWTPRPGYRSTYPPETVRALRDMVARHYAKPHRFICVTDRPEDIDPSIETMPDFGDFADLPSPHGGKNPSCYRRLRVFHPEAAQWFGERVVSLDLDMTLVGDVAPLWERPEDIVLYGDTNPRTHYNGSMVLLRTGSRAQVWTGFDPVTSPEVARRKGFFGSDQGWISYVLGPGEAKWTRRDGVYSYRNEIAQDRERLPADARVVVWHGNHDPWSDYAQQIGWVRQHWGVVEKPADKVAVA